MRQEQHKVAVVAQEQKGEDQKGMATRQRKGGAAAMPCFGSRSSGGGPPVDAATSSTNEIHGYNRGFSGVGQTSPSAAFFGGSPMYRHHQPLDVATCFVACWYEHVVVCLNMSQQPLPPIYDEVDPGEEVGDFDPVEVYTLEDFMAEEAS
ncbi:hypothetical protein GUJ93_ZPchr0007g4225 [Zizania palustris]|uniref:Uncharacterized protein n=1 Tax=Zizania palustris TaxID=103762 RepID=A0A8J5VZG7_ZIZPA|nr:hypothetical protein GUJ93_ZPchr0007g4225 [Zizania palustris]